MKKYLSLIVILFLSSASLAFADNTAAPLTPAEKQAFAQEKAKLTQQTVASKFSGITAQITQTRQNLLSISDRIQAVIEKPTDVIIQTGDAANLIVKAEASLDLAKNKEDALLAAIGTGKSMDEIKSTLSSEKDALQNAYNYLSQAITTLQNNGAK